MPNGSSTARRISAAASVMTLGTWIAGVALAGPPPATCRPAGGTGCNILSDLLVFAEGDPLFEVVARITECHACTPPNAAGVFQLDGEVEMVFGPYDPTIAGCNAADDTIQLPSFVAPLRPGAGSGPARTQSAGPSLPAVPPVRGPRAATRSFPAGRSHAGCCGPAPQSACWPVGARPIPSGWGDPHVPDRAESRGVAEVHWG